MTPSSGDGERAGSSAAIAPGPGIGLDAAACRRRLRQMGARADGDIDLMETALLLGAIDRTSVSFDWYRDHLAQIAKAVRAASARESADARGAATAIASVIAGQFGYRGDRLTYDDLQNANMLRVIDRRKGLPVALGILYMHIGRIQGWTMAGLDFPGHFLIRLERAGERVILDPFDDGVERGPADLRGLLKVVAGVDAELKPEHYRTVGDRAVLLRLLANVKQRNLATRHPRRALRVVETMLLIAPNEPMLWRECGLLNGRIGNLGAAIDGLEKFIANGEDEGLLHQAAVLLQQLKARRH
ncbi:MAG: SirB1 family protein [Inquilinaceae bacterium]